MALIATQLQCGFSAPLFEPVSITVQPKEVHAIVGENGVGKTTLLRCLAGRQKPMSGTVQLDNTASIGWLGDDLPWWQQLLTVRQMLCFKASQTRVNANGLTPEAVMGLTGITDAACLPIRHLSSGYLKRYLLSEALLANPQYLILDEPLGALSPSHRDAVIQVLMVLSEVRGIVLSTHHIDCVSPLATHIHHLSAQGLQPIRTPLAQPVA